MPSNAQWGLSPSQKKEKTLFWLWNHMSYFLHHDTLLSQRKQFYVSSVSGQNVMAYLWT